MKSENNDDNKNAESRVQVSAGGARRTAARQKNAGSRTRQYRGGSKNRQDKPFRPTAKKTAAGGAVKNSRNTQKPAKTGGRPSGRKTGRRTTSKLKIIPLGGLEQIGMNITAFEYGDSIVVVDCGLSFPEDDMLGIDLVIPDVTYLKENISKVKGFVITHGHEDHIGALPYVLKEINVPIYATKLTLGLIRNKLKEHNLMRSTKLKEVKHGQVINLGDFAVEFIKTNHSIQDASALAIYSPVGIVIHTGDFKVDYTPVFGDAIDLQRFAEIGKKGVLALMCESTNAERPGFTMSERTVGHVFDNLFNEYRTSRIIIATFASNVDRVQQIINTAYRFGRKVAVEGRSMVNVISVASELGYLQIPENTLIEIDQVKNYPDDKVVLITTGSQGESMAALSRMAANIHKKITIKPNDTIIFSSNPIPGNEKAVSKVINELSMKGAIALFYVTVMLSCIYRIRMLSDGAYMVVLVFLSAWGNDTLAYCTGRLIGKHKMSPILSPKKTVEGAIGGVIGAGLLGCLYGLFAKQFLSVNYNLIVVFGIVCAVGGLISIIGDLGASAIKRNYDIKDYSHLIPGHGGILDRFDSIIFTAPIIYYMLVMVVGLK